MAEEFRFFDHVNGDRSYNADAFAEYFRQVLTSGILNGGTNLQVSCDGTDRKAHIKAGKAWLEGYYYKNTDDTLTLFHDAADGTLDRIDRVILRLDKNTDKRYIKAFVLKGAYAINPVAPVLTRNDTVYEISLAQVYITHNTSVIGADKVTDERLDTSVCGLVNSLIQADTTEMQKRFDAFMESLEGQGYVNGETFQTLSNDFDAHKLDYVRQPGYASATGAANTYVVTLNPAPAVLVDGLSVAVKINMANTGASTINVNGLGAKAIKKSNGNDVAAGNLKPGVIYTLRYNATTGNFILQGEGGSGNAQPNDVWKGKTFTNDEGDQVGTFAIDALLADYVIAEGESLSAGSLVEFINNQARKPVAVLSGRTGVLFSGNSTDEVVAVALDGSHVLVGFDANYSYVVVLTVSETTITVGETCYIGYDQVTYFRLKKIDSTHALIIFYSGSILGRVVTVSGSTATLGSAITIRSGAAYDADCVCLDSTHALAFVKSSDIKLHAFSVTISGTSLTVGSDNLIVSGNCAYFKANELDSTHVVLCYYDNTNTQAIVLTISENTVTVGTPVVVKTGLAEEMSMLRLDGSRVLFGYRDGTNSGYGTICVLSVSSDSITVGSKVIFNNAETYESSLAMLDTNVILISYDDRRTGNGYGTIQNLNVSGTTITTSTPLVFLTRWLYYNNIVALSKSLALDVYAYVSSPYDGYCNVINISANKQGLALEDGIAGETKKFYDWR